VFRYTLTIFFVDLRLLVEYSVEQKCNRERIGTWNAEQRLICDLLDNYQVKWGRPVRNMTEDVEVRFGLQLIHISDLVREYIDVWLRRSLIYI
jgi:hypothetical protein